MQNYIRIACAVPAVKVGNVAQNANDICLFMEQADGKSADVLLFPELALTGFSCGDLFFQETLWEAVKAGVKKILDASEDCPQLTTVFGLPVRLQDKLFNCAAVVRNGAVLGLVPKTYIPNYNPHQEKSWFASANDLGVGTQATLFGAETIPVGADCVFSLGDGAVLGVEICEDLLSPIPPSAYLAMSGANVIVNLSASYEVVGKREWMNQMVAQQSGRCKCVYAYCSAGCTESTSDLVFSGSSLICENGKCLAKNDRLPATDYILVADCDLGRIQADRMRNTTFRDASAQYGNPDLLEMASEREGDLRGDGALYPLRKLVFVPEDEKQRQQRCEEVFALQVAGLKQRLSVIGANAVVGISGGLDSTLAMLVAVEAMRQLGRPATDVHCITMPCFGTSDRTYQNAWELMRTLGVSAKEVSIRDAVNQHFKDIGHDSSNHNTTYENAQARERTQVLMDYAGTVGAIVVGTGDLSELALGWCTYNGDQMSMYGVNADVPKTLIPYVIDAVAQRPEFEASREVLKDILATPISPELLPPDEKGNISQQTEDLVGPYALHDFFLYHMLRFGFTPTKIYAMACRAFEGEYSKETVKKWLKTFYRRFFAQQFKRSCMPDGVKVGSVGLSPRGDLKMPSDACSHIWLQEIEQL